MSSPVSLLGTHLTWSKIWLLIPLFQSERTLTWISITSDSFREEDKPDSMRPSMNMMPRLFIFMWIGLVAPWPQILSNDIISIRRVLCLGIGIILLRRIPVLLALYKNLRQEQNIQNAVSMGLGGHIGVGAILYLSLSLRFLQDNMVVDGHMREDVNQLAGTMYIVVWSLVLWSVVRIIVLPHYLCQVLH